MTQPPYGPPPPPYGPPPPPSQGGWPQHEGQPPYGGQPAYGDQPSYGQGGGFGQPGYDQSGGYAQPHSSQYGGQPSGGQPYSPGADPYGGPQGPYGPPPRKSPLPWIIGGLVLLLVLGGLGLFLSLKDDAPSTVATTQTTEQTTQTSETADSAEESTEESTEDSTESTEEISDELVDADSPDLATAFVQQMASGDYQSAFATLTADFQTEYADAQAFATDFFSVIGATVITSWTVSDAFGHEGDHDDIVFDLETDTGSAGVLLAVIEEAGELRVFDFVSP